MNGFDIAVEGHRIARNAARSSSQTSIILRPVCCTAPQFTLYRFKNHILLFDMAILVRTAKVVLMGKGVR